MKFDEDAIFADYPRPSDEFGAFCKTKPALTEEGLKEWQKQFDTYLAEWQAEEATWKERHKDYFDYTEGVNKRRIKKCMSCGNCIPQEKNCCMWIERSLKCSRGFTVRENGFCKAYIEREGGPFKWREK